MGLLGDFLEVMYGPDDRWRTIRAVVRQWSNLGAAARERSGQRALGRLKPGRAAPDRIMGEDIRIWTDGAGRVRLETTRRWDDRSESSLVVR